MSVIYSSSQKLKRRGRRKEKVLETPFEDTVNEESFEAKEEFQNIKKYRNIVFSRLVANGGIFTFCLLFVVFLLYDGILATKQPLNIEALTKDLKSNVEGQQDAIDLVLEGVQKMHSLDNKLNIISFFGSTGVGKTHITQIVKNHFPLSTYEIQGPLYYFDINKFVDRVRNNEFRYNLIIIDDLTLPDVDSLLDLLMAIPKDLGVVVICIFNIQETDNYLNHSINHKQIDYILEKFDKAYVPIKAAKFHQFDENQANCWIRKQLIGKEVNDKIINEILAEQNFEYHGFKGLSSKLNLIKF